MHISKLEGLFYCGCQLMLNQIWKNKNLDLDLNLEVLMLVKSWLTQIFIDLGGGAVPQFLFYTRHSTDLISCALL